jgi:galactokinase
MGTKHTISEWYNIFANFRTSGILDWLKRNYGDDDARILDRAGNFKKLLAEVNKDATFDPSVKVIIGRTPCRVRVFSGHTDFKGCGGYLVNFAANLEMLYVGQKRGDRKVVLRNMSPEFKSYEFSLDEWDTKPADEITTAEDWDRWCVKVEKRKKQEFMELLKKQKGKSVPDDEFNEEWTKLVEKNWQEFVKGIVAFIQTDLGDPGGTVRKRFNGFNALFWSEIPMGWGLSSSSALVMSVAQILNEIFNLDFTDSEMINLGLCEHYNGTKGGMNDHASIIKGISGKILLMRSYPEEIVESAKFPQDVSLFLVGSGVKRSQAPEMSDKFKREGIKDSAVIFARTGIGYALASLWIRHHFPEYRDSLRPRPGQTNDTYGLLREFNKTGQIHFDNENKRTKEIYRVLKKIPQRITREELFTEMNEFKGELEALFATHPEPDGGYRLRGMALYGLAENERSFEYLNRATADDFEGMLELMRISQNGDRVVRYEFGNQETAIEKPFNNQVTDEDLDIWINRPEQNPIWQKPGFFERSIERVDLLCDLIDNYFGEIAAARVSAAGLGGAVTVLAKSNYVEKIRDFLLIKRYKSIPPLIPSPGSSIVTISLKQQK